MDYNRDWYRIIIGAIIVVLIAFVILFFYLRGSTYSETVTRVNMVWHRYIPIEIFKAVSHNDSDYGQSLPDAYNVDHYSRSVEESYDCNPHPVKVGTAKVTEYDTCYTWHTYYYVSYTRNEWVFDHNLETSGGIHDERVYADFTPSPMTVLGSVRAGARYEVFDVDFMRADGKTQITYNPAAYEEWLTYNVPTKTYTLTFNRLEQILWETLKVDAR